VARRLGLAFLDTGAMYRAATWLAVHRKVDLADTAAVADLVRGAEMDIVLEPDAFSISIDGTDVTKAIRAPRVSAVVSAVATNLEVRADLVDRQKRLIAETRDGIVAEGRDITTVVAPDADIRVLLVADPQARVARRHAEMADHADVHAITDQVIRRDRDDSTVAQFTSAAPGVHVIDSTEMTLNEVIAAICDLVPAASPGTS
jgi:cytidylate kinase